MFRLEFKVKTRFEWNSQGISRMEILNKYLFKRGIALNDIHVQK